MKKVGVLGRREKERDGAVGDLMGGVEALRRPCPWRSRTFGLGRSQQAGGAQL